MTDAGDGGRKSNALGRILRWRPRTYRQAWLSAAIGQALPWLIVYSVFGTMNGWRNPWPILCFEGTAILLVGGGLIQSYMLYRQRHKKARVLAQ